MNIINLNKQQLSKLKSYSLPDDLFVAESKMFLFPQGSNNKNVNRLFKMYNTKDTRVLDNKLRTILSLVKYEKIININSFVFPKDIMMLDNSFVGYTMDLVDGCNLEEMLYSYDISVERKIDYLYQIGIMLEKINNVRKYTELKDFYLIDIHENNFIVDKSDMVWVIDVDSVKIDSNYVSTMGSKYLHEGSILLQTDKYKIDEFNVYGASFIPSRDIELYCYNIMILNFLYGGGIEYLSLEEIYDYLEYLSMLGINRELINIFKKLMSNASNGNPYNLLKEIIPVYQRCHKNVYKCNKRR